MNLTVNKLAAAGAAEITDLDCSQPLSPETFAALKQVFLDHLILAIRDQRPTAAQQASFSRQFGPLEAQDRIEYTHPDDKDVLILSNEIRPDGSAVGIVDAGDYWHSDSSHLPEPCQATLLYAVRNPSRGGDTEFCNMCQVYDSLPADLKNKIEGREAIHHVSKTLNRRVTVSLRRPDAKDYYERRAREMALARQPMVRTHPETGRQALYVSPRFTIAIDGMDDAEAQPLLDELFAIMAQRRFHYRHKWRDGDLVMWDNRCLVHRACGGYALPDIRRMHRTTIRGGKPFYPPAAGPPDWVRVKRGRAMEADMLHAAGQALLIIMDPHRLLYLFAGVCMGLGLGILPGIGGIAGTALLLPFTYDMDPASAFALLLGLGASTTTADPVSAILFGVPGHAASAATTLDGYPLTRQGYAGRALGASYMSALMGGLFGAALLGISLPVLRPIMLQIGSPELLSLAVFGISMVSVLSGNTPLRGLTAACFGVMLSMIGSDPHTGTMRWTLDSLYLWDGLPLVPITLGIFALPELCDLAIARTAVVEGGMKIDTKTGMLLGIKDCFTHWFLILRCSWIGAGFGAVPGIGASVIDWISYGHALRTEKGAPQSFGSGDIRGVIAAESATNAKEGGALVPTVAFGVPASAGMAILLGAFLMHGLVPGPDMLTKNLDVTYAMVWSIAVANILGSGLCFLFSGQLAKLATLRYTLIMPIVLSLVYIGAFEGTRQWGDLYSLMFFGLLGWAMKHMKWPRPPLVLGFILGKVLERYLFISIERYGSGWMLRPVVIIMFALAFLTLMRPFLQDVRARGGIARMLSDFGRPRLNPGNLFTAALLCLFAAMLGQAREWNFQARIVPVIVGCGALLFGTLALANEMFGKPGSAGVIGIADRAKADIERQAGARVHRRIHMDIATNISHLPVKVKLLRGAGFFGWMTFFLFSMALIGLIPTVPLFIAAYMRVEGRERWSLVMPMATFMALFIYGLFDQLLLIPWPQSYLGILLPALRVIPSV